MASGLSINTTTRPGDIVPSLSPVTGDGIPGPPDVRLPPHSPMTGTVAAAQPPTTPTVEYDGYGTDEDDDGESFSDARPVDLAHAFEDIEAGPDATGVVATSEDTPVEAIVGEGKSEEYEVGETVIFRNGNPSGVYVVTKTQGSHEHNVQLKPRGSTDEPKEYHEGLVMKFPPLPLSLVGQPVPVAAPAPHPEEADLVALAAATADGESVDGDLPYEEAIAEVDTELNDDDPAPVPAPVDFHIPHGDAELAAFAMRTASDAFVPTVTLSPEDALALAATVTSNTDHITTPGTADTTGEAVASALDAGPPAPVGLSVGYSGADSTGESGITTALDIGTASALNPANLEVVALAADTDTTGNSHESAPVAAPAPTPMDVLADAEPTAVPHEAVEAIISAPAPALAEAEPAPTTSLVPTPLGIAETEEEGIASTATPAFVSIRDQMLARDTPSQMLGHGTKVNLKDVEGTYYLVGNYLANSTAMNIRKSGNHVAKPVMSSALSLVNPDEIMPEKNNFGEFKEGEIVVSRDGLMVDTFEVMSDSPKNKATFELKIPDSDGLYNAIHADKTFFKRSEEPEPSLTTASIAAPVIDIGSSHHDTHASNDEVRLQIDTTATPTRETGSFVDAESTAAPASTSLSSFDELSARFAALRPMFGHGTKLTDTHGRTLVLVGDAGQSDKKFFVRRPDGHIVTRMERRQINFEASIDIESPKRSFGKFKSGDEVTISGLPNNQKYIVDHDSPDNEAKLHVTKEGQSTIIITDKTLVTPYVSESTGILGTVGSAVVGASGFIANSLGFNNTDDISETATGSVDSFSAWTVDDEDTDGLPSFATGQPASVHSHLAIRRDRDSTINVEQGRAVIKHAEWDDDVWIVEALHDNGESFEFRVYDPSHSRAYAKDETVEVVEETGSELVNLIHADPEGNHYFQRQSDMDGPVFYYPNQ